MTTRALATTALSTVLLLGAAACGGSDDAEPKAAPAKTSATPEAVPTPTGTAAQYAAELVSAKAAAEQTSSARDDVLQAVKDMETFRDSKGEYPKDLAEATSAARLPAGSEVTAYERHKLGFDVSVTSADGTASLDGATFEITSSVPAGFDGRTRANLLRAALQFAEYLDAAILTDKTPASDAEAQASFVTYVEAADADAVNVQFSQVQANGEGDYSFMVHGPDVTDGEKVVLYDAKSVAKFSKNVDAERAAE